jgi:hypothetical protein
MSIELADCENTIIAEIENPECKRKDIAQTYALILKSSERDKVDWPKINRKIMLRWSLSGLRWIKQQAWSGKAFVTPPPVNPE